VYDFENGFDRWSFDFKDEEVKEILNIREYYK
jgi:hypothetical protein